MTWGDALGNLNDAVVGAFSQPVTFTVAGVDTILNGVFDVAYSRGEGPTERAYSRPDHRVTVQTSDLGAIDAQAGDTVTIEGKIYYIADIVEDDGGMTEVIVRPG